MFLSDSRRAYDYETLDFAFYIGSTPTFLYFDLYFNTAYAAHYVYFPMRKGRSRLRDDGNGKMSGFFGGGNFKRKMTCRLGMDH